MLIFYAISGKKKRAFVPALIIKLKVTDIPSEYGFERHEVDR